MGSLKYLHQGKVNTVDFVKQSESPLKILDGGIVKGIPLGEGPIKLMTGGKVRSIGGEKEATGEILVFSNLGKDWYYDTNLELKKYYPSLSWPNYAFYDRHGEGIGDYFFEFVLFDYTTWRILKQSWDGGEIIKMVDAIQKPEGYYSFRSGMSDLYIYQVWYTYSKYYQSDITIDVSRWDLDLNFVDRRTKTYERQGSERSHTTDSEKSLACSKDEDKIFCFPVDIGSPPYTRNYIINTDTLEKFNLTLPAVPYEPGPGIGWTTLPPLTIVDKYAKEILFFSTGVPPFLCDIFNFDGSDKRQFSSFAVVRPWNITISPTNYFYLKSKGANYHEITKTNKTGTVKKKTDVESGNLTAIKWRHQWEENVS